MITRKHWSAKEDQILIDNQGVSYDEIVKYLPNRTESSVRTRNWRLKELGKISDTLEARDNAALIYFLKNSGKRNTEFIKVAKTFGYKISESTVSRMKRGKKVSLKTRKPVLDAIEAINNESKLSDYDTINVFDLEDVKAFLKPMSSDFLIKIERTLGYKNGYLGKIIKDEIKMSQINYDKLVTWSENPVIDENAIEIEEIEEAVKTIIENKENLSNEDVAVIEKIVSPKPQVVKVGQTIDLFTYETEGEILKDIDTAIKFVRHLETTRESINNMINDYAASKVNVESYKKALNDEREKNANLIKDIVSFEKDNNLLKDRVRELESENLKQKNEIDSHLLNRINKFWNKK
jgi:hypothetical protein